jgi:UDP-2,3-diacylglucosamine pyrophosphatase LpxH
MTFVRCTAVLLAALMLLGAAGALENAGNTSASNRQDRYLAVISDLHMGLGKAKGGAWHAVEDFRWPRALEGFLEELSRLGNHAVDLVIAGDFVELWQPPVGITCKGPSEDLGCTVTEMESIAAVVAAAHSRELEALRLFAMRGENRLHVIPGNHDSTLLLDTVWKLFADKLGASSGRVQLVRSGVWVSTDGRVLVEHGHQIGADANRYGAWPEIMGKHDNTRYVVRPWGERFVQLLFNEQEQEYPIIDNLSPETAGARYRMADRGVWGTAFDMARFVAFNLFETSATQKAAALGPPTGDEASKWNLVRARSAGHRLFLAALPSDDAFRATLIDENPQAKAVRDELDKALGDASYLSDADVRALCDLAAANTTDGWQLCRAPELGALLQSKLVPLSWVLSTHIAERMREHKAVTVFIYGHTHQMQPRWDLSVTGGIQVGVLNSGAFQRLVDEEGFRERARKKEVSEVEALRQLTPDDLAPCYGVVMVPYRKRRPDPMARLWWMPETASKGELLSPGDPRCG